MRIYLRILRSTLFSYRGCHFQETGIGKNDLLEMRLKAESEYLNSMLTVSRRAGSGHRLTVHIEGPLTCIAQVGPCFSSLSLPGRLCDVLSLPAVCIATTALCT